MAESRMEDEDPFLPVRITHNSDQIWTDNKLEQNYNTSCMNSKPSSTDIAQERISTGFAPSPSMGHSKRIPPNLHHWRGLR
jgi:hypothetical protein